MDTTNLARTDVMQLRVLPNQRTLAEKRVRCSCMARTFLTVAKQLIKASGACLVYGALYRITLNQAFEENGRTTRWASAGMYIYHIQHNKTVGNSQ